MHHHIMAVARLPLLRVLQGLEATTNGDEMKALRRRLSSVALSIVLKAPRLQNTVCPMTRGWDRTTVVLVMVTTRRNQGRLPTWHNESTRLVGHPILQIPVRDPIHHSIMT
jgi:hypothetical protein